MLRLFFSIVLSVATALADSGKWEKDIVAFESAPIRKGSIIFTGSSTIRLWESLEKEFPTLPILNRGFGGSKMSDSANFAERLVVPHEPKMIVLFAGTNDINAGSSPEDIVASFETWITKVRAKLPKTELCLLEITSSPSRWEQREKVVAANSLLRGACDRHGVKFIPIRDKFLGPDGRPREELFVADRLHLNSDGYKILADAVRPFLPRE